MRFHASGCLATYLDRCRRRFSRRDRQREGVVGPRPAELLPPVEAAIEQPAGDYFDLDAWLAGAETNPLAPRDDWSWQLLPDGILYRAYLANPKESRLGTQIFNSPARARCGIRRSEVGWDCCVLERPTRLAARLAARY